MIRKEGEFYRRDLDNDRKVKTDREMESCLPKDPKVSQDEGKTRAKSAGML